jgi:hypothetical protein
MSVAVLIALVGCGMPHVHGFDSGQTGRPITGPIVGASVQDLWAPLAENGDGYSEGFGHYDGSGWAIADTPPSYSGFAAGADGLWTASYEGLVQIAPNGTITDRTADLPQPVGGVAITVQGTPDGHIVMASGVENDGDSDDLVLSSIEHGVVTPILTVPGGGMGNYNLSTVNGPGDAYLFDNYGIHRVRDGAIIDVPHPGWNATMFAPRIASAGPDDAWTAAFTVDADGVGHQTFYHDDGTGFVAVPIEEWDYVELGGAGAIVPLPGGDAIVLSSRITHSSGGGSTSIYYGSYGGYSYYGTGYGGPQLNDMEMLSTHVFADGTMSDSKIVFQCKPIDGEPPCSLYPSNYGVLGDGTIVMLSGELLWWHGPIDAL